MTPTPTSVDVYSIDMSQTLSDMLNLACKYDYVNIIQTHYDSITSWFELFEYILMNDAPNCYKYLENIAFFAIPDNILESILDSDSINILKYFIEKYEPELKDQLYINIMCESSSLKSIEYMITQGIIDIYDFAEGAILYDNPDVMKKLLSYNNFTITNDLAKYIIYVNVVNDDDQVILGAYECMKAVYDNLSYDQKKIMFELANDYSMENFVEYLKKN